MPASHQRQAHPQICVFNCRSVMVHTAAKKRRPCVSDDAPRILLSWSTAHRGVMDRDDAGFC